MTSPLVPESASVAFTVYTFVPNGLVYRYRERETQTQHDLHTSEADYLKVLINCEYISGKGPKR